MGPDTEETEDGVRAKLGIPHQMILRLCVSTFGSVSSQKFWRLEIFPLERFSPTFEKCVHS